jgi:serine/threonine protein kinase/Tol biopolymer transport system component
MTGQSFGHYRIIEKIGAGGMGEVFRARDERLGRDVALKVIRPASSDNPDHLRRFEQEARAAAALNHPNILAIYDVGFEGTTPYIVSELLEGKTLRARLTEGAIPAKEAAGYALQIAHALIAAHERLIVHRDLKPENLFITNDSRIKILDFGVAKLQPSPNENRSVENLTTVTKHGAVIGTVAYMSPEQLRGKTVDHRSDIFSFGAILYEMMSGQRAFRGETEVDTMTAVLREEPSASKLEEASIPAGFQDIVRHCLEKEPENRFQSAKDLAFALQTLSGSAPGTTVVLPRRRGTTPRYLGWTIATLLAIATLTLTTVLVLRPAAAQPSYSRLTFNAGTVYAARFAPNGQSVIYSAAWDGKAPQLFSTIGNSLLSQPLQLTDANLLGVSHDNELALVLHGTHSGQLETIGGMLARAPLAGGSPRELLSDVRWADWDPQGKMAVVHYAEGHCRLEYPLGTVLYQSGGWISNIRFSPKADHIAFMEHPALWDSRGTVRVLDLSGRDQTLSREWDSEDGLAWRPDGKEIWFTAAEKGNDLNLKAVTLSGEMRTLLDLPMGITLEDVAPDGRVLVALGSKRLAMGFTSLASEGKGDIDLSYHDWNSPRSISRDGQFVLFEDSSEAVGPGYAVMMRKVDGTPPIRLGEGSAGGMSPDGKWAISVSTSKAPQITLLPIGAGQPRTINVSGVTHLHNGWARFHPDGQRIVIDGDETGHSPRCYIVDLAKGFAKGVTPEGVLCGPLSPDGRSIVGVQPDRSSVIYSLEGGPQRMIPNLGNNFTAVQWSTDGSLLYGYHLGEFPSVVYKVDIATGKETAVHELKPSAPAGVVIIAPVVVSSDGKNFAYAYNQTMSVLFEVSGLK